MNERQETKKFYRKRRKKFWKQFRNRIRRFFLRS